MSYANGVQDITFNGTVVPCNDDRDCPLNSICYFPFPNAPKQGQCGCSVEFGEVGNICDQLSIASYFRLATFAVMILLSLILIVFVLRDICILKSNKKFKYLDAKSTTLVQVGITMISICIAQAAGILSVFDHHNVSIVPDIIQGFRKVRAYSIVRDIATAFYCFFYVASALNIGLLWLEVAIASNKFQTMSTSQIKSQYRWLIVICNTLMFITVIVILRINPPLGALATIPFALFICVIFIYSVHAISNVINARKSMRLISIKANQISKLVSNTVSMDSASPNPDISMPSQGTGSPIRGVGKGILSPYTQRGEDAAMKVRTSLQRTQFCAGWVISSTFLIIMFIVVSGVSGNQARVQARPDGRVHLIFITTFLAILFAYIGCIGIIWYVHLAVRNTLVSNSSKTDSNTEKLGQTLSKQALSTPRNSNLTEGSTFLPRTFSNHRANGSFTFNDPELLEKS